MTTPKRIGIGFLCAILGYFVGLFGSVLVQSWVGPHGPDSGMAAGIAGAMFFGPLVAVLGFVAGVLFTKPPAPKITPPTDR